MFVAVVTALLIATATPQAQAQSADAATDGDTYRLLNLFGDVFERVRAGYVDDTSDKELIEAAISGMLSSLDPHSGYLSADSFREMQVQTRGAFGGLGIEVTMENGLVKVVSPIDDTPAYRAGLEPGDLITHLDGEAVLGMTLGDAVEKMRGRVGSEIVLTVRRDGREPFDVAIVRDTIRITSVRSRLEGQVGYIRISSFNEQTEEALKGAMRDLQSEAGNGGLAGIVLDLRNNPGGLLSQAVAVADAFLDRGEIVSTGSSRRPEESQRFNARAGEIASGLPMVVLINAGSASASEIVAGALQDHGRALVLGTKSFGKASVQTVIPLTGYGAIRLTTARYYTPGGRSIQAKGIEPDIVVEPARIETVAQTAHSREENLRGALDRPEQDAGFEGGAPGRSDDGEAGAPSVRQDYQLLRAIDLIRGIALYSDKTASVAAMR
ncbi:MAG: S41 family peptidase [Rhodospirillales bacterium]|nr:MAG: S41 family peptidase [Rhodospirillales bacterium]